MTPATERIAANVQRDKRLAVELVEEVESLSALLNLTQCYMSCKETRQRIVACVAAADRLASIARAE